MLERCRPGPDDDADMTRRFRAVASVLVVGSLAGSCSVGRDVTRRARSAEHVVVASFDFTESRLLAEIYAQVLEANDVPVARELSLGPRELVQPALQQGFVDVVPEYLGTALGAFAPGTDLDPSDTRAVRAALRRAVRPYGLRVLAPAPAQNQNTLVVTRATSLRFGIEATSDLAPLAHRFVLAGPPECPERRYCLDGLRDVYGLRFRQFVAVAGASRVRRALDDGVADVGVMFTTDGELAARDLVALRDDRQLQPVDNVTPVVSDDALARYGDRTVRALDRVSARLSTATLRFLNWRVDVAGNDLAAEARAWLVRHDLVPRVPTGRHDR
jgi:osmoprotectant transport system substrate-binding protein